MSYLSLPSAGLVQIAGGGFASGTNQETISFELGNYRVINVLGYLGIDDTVLTLDTSPYVTLSPSPSGIRGVANTLVNTTPSQVISTSNIPLGGIYPKSGINNIGNYHMLDMKLYIGTTGSNYLNFTWRMVGMNNGLTLGAMVQGWGWANISNGLDGIVFNTGSAKVWYPSKMSIFGWSKSYFKT